MSLTPAQEVEVVALVRRFDAVDDGRNLPIIEEALRLGLEATSDAFYAWEQADGPGVLDEFSLSQDQVACLTSEERLAYVARLLRTFALMYGVSTEFSSGEPLGVSAHEGTAAELLRAINDMAVSQ